MHLDKFKLIKTCKRLPINVDTNLLWKEIQSIPASYWGEARSPVHNDVDALFVKGYPPIQNKPDDERAILASLPYIRKLIYVILPGTPAKCLIAKLNAHGVIPMHRDGNGEPGQNIFEYFRKTVRIHIPVVTTDEVLFYCHSGFINMSEGEVWAINNLADHGVINLHPFTDRYHLIVDMELTNELFSLLASIDAITGDENAKALSKLVSNSYCPPESQFSRPTTN